MTPPTLETAKGRIRALSRSDAGALFEAFSDPETMTYWSTPPHQSLQQTEDDIAWWLAANPDAAFAIEDANGQVVGRTGLFRIREGVREIGVLLRRDRVGRGHAAAAVRVLCAYGFSQLGLHRITADIDPDNASSRRLFEACGFALEACLKHNWRTHLGLRDSLIYALFPEGS
ncbi:MAG: GNAT family N-acetyltransferase [Alphaproteobacteria bacterium]|nr:GNAT family N-acetyltransferase [Alphaproteobacteria bacterium]